MEIKPLNLMWLVDILRKNVFDAEFWLQICGKKNAQSSPKIMSYV